MEPCNTLADLRLIPGQEVSQVFDQPLRGLPVLYLEIDLEKGTYGNAKELALVEAC